MDENNQPQLTGPQMAVLGTLLACSAAAFFAALLGDSERSARGFRLLNMLHNRGEAEVLPAEVDR
ncbi:hypothetical protein OG618_37090 (plasmid) [Kitasatospora sp. NBC_01246]|uniref:hypothetical protein n=1 Tax=Kitasatospora sp. NBC_01246 TaxID=2903570 RepID=UPI002E357F6C|nr:hypothetical protein [Kitasatospora sp. NBC_01246]